MAAFTLRERIKLTISILSFAVLITFGVIAPKALLLYLGFIVALTLLSLAAVLVLDWFHKRP